MTRSLVIHAFLLRMTHRTMPTITAGITIPCSSGVSPTLAIVGIASVYCHRPAEMAQRSMAIVIPRPTAK